MVQLDSSAVGRTVDEESLNGLPLVTRNFTQIAGLSPGVLVGVSNAAELGAGATASPQVGKSNDGIYVHGARSYENSWYLDGINITDMQGSGPLSGGIPIPNPDALAEFKVQTGFFDAGFGPGAGSNVSVVSKTGGELIHGTVFEYLRNDALNANDFFRNETGQPRAALKQNQFGFAVGGPVLKERLFFFGSYQGTRQVNGIAAGQSRVSCAATLSEPALTNDRSPAALGRLFGGLGGASGGVAVNPAGSNINPAALALLNLKLPDGRYLIPNPQTIDPSKPVASRGFSTFTEPCSFDEDQGMGSLRYVGSARSELVARIFLAGRSQSVTFPGGALNMTSSNVQGFDSPGGSTFAVFSLGHSYTLGSNILNNAEFGFVHSSTWSKAQAPFQWSGVGVLESSMNNDNQLPSLNVLGSVSMASVLPRTYTQNNLTFSDVIDFTLGAHLLRVGGDLTRVADDLTFTGLGSYLQFLSWPDFLLGLDATGNGTGSFSNVFASADIFGQPGREFLARDGSAFLQDDYRVARTLTLNLGLRYDRIGQFGDKLGRSSSFDFSDANSAPPAGGSLDGYIVGINFPAALPAGVVRASNTAANYGRGENAISPRIGFAWQPFPGKNELALRGGYGTYYSRPPGQAYTLSALGAPYAITRFSTGGANAGAAFQTPFAEPFPSSTYFPLFVPYSSTTSSTVSALAPDFRPAKAQQFSLSVQAEVRPGWLWEIGYFGTRGQSLQRLRSLNQALSASSDNPVRGGITNTFANISSRVPIPGIAADSLRILESDGESWYNALETSLSKRLSHGLQLLASYTFSKTLDTDGADVDATSAGNALTLGDQNSPSQRRGRASFDRTHRAVFSATWAMPGPHRGLPRTLLANWSLSAVVIVQSGTALTIAATNSANVFGISEDRAQLSGICSAGQLVRSGAIQSNLNQYFNPSCFKRPPVIGSDGIGTGFGNSGTGIVDGPGQANLDLSLARSVPVRAFREHGTLQIRGELFNALNHAQFANPDANYSSPTFGVISQTSVNSRVAQIALRFAF
jgi:hypothetical protein